MRPAGIGACSFPTNSVCATNANGSTYCAAPAAGPPFPSRAPGIFVPPLGGYGHLQGELDVASI